MKIDIGNSPCSWGVEFADDPRNPSWEQVLDECRDSGYKGIELGPVGFLPENPEILGEALNETDLELIGGVGFQPFHEPKKWKDVLDGSIRTCRALNSLGGKYLVIIDSISPKRAPTAGRPEAAIQMDKNEWQTFIGHIEDLSKLAVEEYNLTPCIHAHAGGYMEFEYELDRLLNEIDENLLKICLDTGHCTYAGFDPVSFMKRYIDRIAYMHFKDTDPKVKKMVIENKTGFYDACAKGLFCTLGKGEVDFEGVRDTLINNGYSGWCTVEQDCDPQGDNSPINDAKLNRDYLMKIGF